MAETFTGDSVPVAKKDNHSASLDDGTAIYDGNGHVLIMLNASASAIWEMCDGKSTVQEIVEQLFQEYDGGTEEMREDVVRTLEKLVSIGLLETTINS